MKLFLFVPFSLVLLYVQIISAEHVKFEQVVESFIAKAKVKKIKLNSTLDFMLQISEKVVAFEFLCSKGMPAFITNEKKIEVLAKVPERMEIHGINARAFFAKEFSSINFTLKTTFKQLCDNIIERLNFNSPGVYDDTFDVSFNKWNDRPAKSADVERIQKHWKTMIEQHKKLKNKFDTQTQAKMDTGIKLKTQLNDCRNYFNLLKNANTTERATSLINSRILATLEKINDFWEAKKIHLADIQFTVSKYNQQRVAWAQFLIGTKEIPEKK
ncbi:uncharacterized protein LOC116341098 [Contarinia nasturtii]|uniref:uncharacterized protein LOC116341098 n=1 Tax=Contarinia nasturtii TaxID=265458 RepID=UPI0012D458CF|nr:uncharacterized protein LOC116341098 [Contarinia nasturtii]